MADCEIIGEVQNIAGTGRAKVGTYLTVKDSRLPDDAAHTAGSSQTIDFVVGTDGTLRLKADTTLPAKVAQGADIRFKGDVKGFEAGTRWVTIPNTPTVDINVLAANASAAAPVATSVSQSTFNALEARVDVLEEAPAGGTWGSIEGDLSEQEDLQAALDAKANASALGTSAALNVPASGNAAAGEVVKGNDSRLVDSRTPTGGAGGVLSGSFPNPGFAVDMATQGELDAVSSAVTILGSAVTLLDADLDAEVSRAQAAEALLAPKASPTFTGTPAAPTAAAATNTAQIATTAFVQTAVASVDLSTRQPLDATLTAFAGQIITADVLPYGSGADIFSTTPLTAFARTLLDDANQAAMQATLGLVPGTNVQAYDAELGAIAGLTSAADKAPYFTGSGAASLFDLSSFGRSLIDDVDAAAARTTLGLGSAALLASSAVLQSANNLSDLASPSTARTNLGLGTMATQAESAYALLAGRAGGQTLYGGTASGESLTLNSTSHATKGYILLGTGGLVGVNRSTPAAQIHVVSASSSVKGALLSTPNAAFDLATGVPTLELENADTGAGQSILRFTFGGTTKGGVRSDFNGNFNWHASGYHQFYIGMGVSSPIMNLSASGVRIASTGAGTAASAQLHVVAGSAGTKAGIFSSAASPTAPINEYQVNGTMKGRVTKDGCFATSVNAAPADADVLTNEVQFWFDSSNGAHKVMYKGKTADGTVVTGQLN